MPNIDEDHKGNSTHYVCNKHSVGELVCCVCSGKEDCDFKTDIVSPPKDG